MKELSIEDKAKRYDEALTMAKEIYNGNPLNETAKVVCKQIFLELAESEDEKIIKSFIRLLKAFYDVNFPTPEGFERKDMIAWLEKQGKQKPTKNIIETWKDMRLEAYQQASGNRHEPNYSDDNTKMFSLNDIDNIIEKMSEQKTADKYEPKFKVGDWVINTITNEVEQVIELTDCEYVCSGHLIVSFNDQHILRKIQSINTWKPSEEQIEVLEWQIKNTHSNSWQYIVLKELLQDLKKLKG